MSASERLRELDAVTSAWPNGFSMSRMEATARALSALPLIADLVEAVEKSPPLPLRVADALNDLQEHLEADGE